MLHVAGSPTSDFFVDLSLVYARSCVTALTDPERYRFTLALVTPDDLWRFPRSYDSEDIAAAEPMRLAEALARIADTGADIALPQMFCLSGMTDYRALLGVLGLRYLGNRPLRMALTADKHAARSLVQAAGVAVPSGVLLKRGDSSPVTFPVVVKPNTSDNSDGVSLARSSAELQTALDSAFAFANEVLVETYIELGREVRCGIVVRDGELICLPLEEYFVDSSSRPIRTREHKLKRDSADSLTLAAKHASESWILPTDDPITPTVWDAAKRCHTALGCEQYSLFDFRIDPQRRPWFLEAGLYNSFSPQSVVSTMAAAAGISLPQLFADSVREALRTK